MKTVRFFTLCLTLATAAHARIIYVDDDANAPGDGRSWQTAYKYLQDALADASDGDEVHVAQGIYTPDRGATVTTGDRKAAFRWNRAVIVRGGYAGLGEPDPNERDISRYQTILSGDLSANDVDVNDPCDLLTHPSRAENSYHVVGPCGTETELDGFVITGGNSNGIGSMPGVGTYGAGVYVGPETVRNCTVTRNSAWWAGGVWGVRNLMNCTIMGNVASDSGGGGHWWGREYVYHVTDCTFSGNSGKVGGGGM